MFVYPFKNGETTNIRIRIDNIAILANIRFFKKKKMWLELAEFTSTTFARTSN